MNQHLQPESSPLFTPWTDPGSGVRSHVLTARAAPWQQAFYFTSPNVTDDGRWLWFYASTPPSPHVLGVVDNATGHVDVYPETHFEAESPWIDPESGEAFFAHPGGVFRRLPGRDQPTVEVFTVDDAITGGRDVRRISTHLTRSADRRLLNLDVWAGSRWDVGVIDLQTREFESWLTSDRRFQHSQFHPSDPTKLLVAQDYWHDPDTGERQHWENRIWTLDGPGTAKPLFADDHERVQVQFHEWWSVDGDAIFYVDVGWGTERFDLATGERTTVWPGGTCHSHASADGTLFVGDINTYAWHDEPCRVAFFDTSTGTEVDIVSDWTFPGPRAYAGYHPDPHPQFVLHDEFIAYTTTALGGLDLALVRVDDLLDRTR